MRKPVTVFISCYGFFVSIHLFLIRQQAGDFIAFNLIWKKVCKKGISLHTSAEAGDQTSILRCSYKTDLWTFEHFSLCIKLDPLTASYRFSFFHFTFLILHSPISPTPSPAPHAPACRRGSCLQSQRGKPC